MTVALDGHRRAERGFGGLERLELLDQGPAQHGRSLDDADATCADGGAGGADHREVVVDVYRCAEAVAGSGRVPLERVQGALCLERCGEVEVGGERHSEGEAGGTHCGTPCVVESGDAARRPCLRSRMWARQRARVGATPYVQESEQAGRGIRCFSRGLPTAEALTCGRQHWRHCGSRAVPDEGFRGALRALSSAGRDHRTPSCCLRAIRGTPLDAKPSALTSAKRAPGSSRKSEPRRAARARRGGYRLPEQAGAGLAPILEIPPGLPQVKKTVVLGPDERRPTFRTAAGDPDSSSKPSLRPRSRVSPLR